MKKAYIFPGQGSQFPGMAKDLYDGSEKARSVIDGACDILGFNIRDIMFNGTGEDLKATEVTQAAVFIHSYSAFLCTEQSDACMFAGHSLGEYTALTAAGVLSFEDGLRLVSRRAAAMKKCCDMYPGTMAAVIGLPSDVIEEICSQVSYSHICDEISCRSLGVVIAANYNSDLQTVISGDMDAVNEACARMKDAGAKKCVPLAVSGAFHSPLMESAGKELSEVIEATAFEAPHAPVYQNVCASATDDPEKIKENLLLQLTNPVRWVQTVRNMVSDGAGEFIELGPGNVLKGLVRKILG